ncbi:efflux RND transporter periplasmic adaptor subunit [Bacteroides propionicifaciens]|uniref:efflux RND transporter periplasmic adaptor subunit n=1 Tax=Bacteroides propionicifaciens TaxID=392838 RepID=UPI000467FF5A|nr:efflux RND transporter periplasmic adaptor subunit [Bacteroides propionicifaciens]
MKRKFIIPVVMLVSLFWSCSSGKKTEISRALTAKIDSVEPCTQQLSVSYPGKIKASSDVNLSFRVSGPLKHVYVNVGSKVRKGQLLAEIDPRDYETQLSATQAEYDKVKGEAERIMALYEKRSVSKNDYDKAKFGLEQITAKLKAHKDALSDTKLYAPYDGFIQKKLFDRDETVAAGMPIVSMINNKMPDIEINIPSTEFYQRDLFDTFTCSVDIFPNQTYNLVLKGITHKANLNQLYTMRFTFDESNYANLPTAGMTATVNINKKTSDSNLTIIPLSAVFNLPESQEPMVWIYDRDTQTVSPRVIELSGIQRDGKTIVSKGLTVGEQVVVAGVHSLKKGDRVVPLQPNSKTNVGGLL